MNSQRAYPRHVLNLDSKTFGLAWKSIFQKMDEHVVGSFEKDFADFIGVPHAIGVGSARKGLYLILRSLDLRPGDEIIMPAYTFHFLPMAVIACGLKPVFVDVSDKTYNIDHSLIEEKITDRTRAIVLTHIFGQPCEMEPIKALAEKYKLLIIEDCAHACGTTYKEQHTGAIGDVAIFSFKMGKNLPCFGGGMITTKNEKIATGIRTVLKDFAYPGKWPLIKDIIKTCFYFTLTQKNMFTYVTFPLIRLFDSLNMKWLDVHLEEKINIEECEKLFKTHTTLAPLQARVGLKQLSKLNRVNANRRSNAELMIQELSAIKRIRMPVLIPEAESTFLYFRICVPQVETFRKKLLRRGIDTKRDDMSACSALDVFKDYKAACPVAERLIAESIEIPNNPLLSPDEIKYIAGQIRAVATEVIPQ